MKLRKTLKPTLIILLGVSMSLYSCRNKAHSKVIHMYYNIKFLVFDDDIIETSSFGFDNDSLIILDTKKTIIYINQFKHILPDSNIANSLLKKLEFATLKINSSDEIEYLKMIHNAILDNQIRDTVCFSKELYNEIFSRSKIFTHVIFAKGAATDFFGYNRYNNNANIYYVYLNYKIINMILSEKENIKYYDERLLKLLEQARNFKITIIIKIEDYEKLKADFI